MKKYPAVILLPFLVMGILLADWLRWSPAIFFAAMLILFGFTSFLYLKEKNKQVVAVGLLLAMMMFMSLWYAVRHYQFPPNHISVFAETKEVYTFFGEITDWPKLSSRYTGLLVSIDSIEQKNQREYCEGALFLKISDTTTLLQRGDRVIFSGRLYPISLGSFGSRFNYANYLNYKGVGGQVYLTTPLDIVIDKGSTGKIYSIIDSFRKSIRETLYTYLEPEPAAVAVGFLIGETRDIPLDVYKHFKESGTLHLLAVSGSNVALVILFVSLVLLPFKVPRRLRQVLYLLTVLLFALLAYGEPSVIRASVMAVLVIGANLFERRYNLNNIIGLAGILILLYDPAQLFSIGFQLSFVIAWGLIFTLSILEGLFKKYRRRVWYRFGLWPFLIAVTAQLFAMGLIGLYFHQIPIMSPFANIVIVPLVSAAVVGVLFLLLATFLLPILGKFFAGFVNFLLLIILKVVRFFSGEQMPLWDTGNWNFPEVIWWYILITVAIAAIGSKVARRSVVFLLLAGLVVFSGTTVYNRWFVQRTYEVTSTTVPGGIMSVVSDGFNSAHLIMTNIDRTSYPVDERIVVPFLKEQQIHHLDKIFVLQAVYPAWERLRMIAEQFQVDTILVPSLLYGVASESFAGSSCEVVPMYPRNPTAGLDTLKGIFLSELGLHIHTSDENWLLTDRLNNELLSPQYGCFRQVLVVGSSWYLLNEEINKLFQTGTTEIIVPSLDNITVTESAENLIILNDKRIVELRQLGVYSR